MAGSPLYLDILQFYTVSHCKDDFCYEKTHKCIIFKKPNFKQQFLIYAVMTPQNPKGVEIAFIKN